MLRGRRSRSRSWARSATAVICGFAAAWLFDLSTLEGMLLGAIISSTDGAAIFALLRESTLRRRLARTLEGEAGFNDPVAVLLVIGFIEWIQQAGLRRARHGAPVRARDGDRRGGGHRASGWLAVPGAAKRAPRQSRALPGRHAGDRRPRVRRRRQPARLGLPRRLPGRPGARLGANPGEADGDRLPRGPCLGRADRRCSLRSGCSCSRASSTTSGSRGPRSRSCSCSSRVRSPRALATAFEPLHGRGAAGARVGRAARRGAGGARHLPGDRGPRSGPRRSSTSSSSPS